MFHRHSTIMVLVIDQKVASSFNLREKSEHILAIVIRTVEMAIEQGEDAALAWLKDKVE